MLTIMHTSSAPWTFLSAKYAKSEQKNRMVHSLKRLAGPGP